jgi:Predicted Fe-S-cluster redox enzyme
MLVVQLIVIFVHRENGVYPILTAGEILDQFLQLQKIIEKKITNVVFMGMGEPFLNYNNSILAADLLHHPKGINMGAWRITISTARNNQKDQAIC